MSQNLVPINGGRKNIETTPSTLPGIYISSQYLKAKNLNPTPAEWVPGGRPVYGRLPSASERYKVSFGYDDNSAYVYLPPGESIFGPKTLQIIASDDKKFLIIKPGTVVWRYGQFDIDPTIVDVSKVGLGNSSYQFAYQLFLDSSPIDYLYKVESYSLKGHPMKVVSNTDSVKGWRFQPRFAFYGSDEYEWRNRDPVFPLYLSEAEIKWQFLKSATFSQIEVRCPSNTYISGSATLYMATCQSGGSEEGYCQELNFEESSTVPVQSDSSGQFFKFVIDSPTSATAWKIKWTDSNASVKDILVTGTISLRKKPEESLTKISLVAYPKDTLPSSTIDGYGNVVPAVYCKLAQVDISSSETVTKVTDLRESVNTSYQPIAEWLTRPIDEDLTSMYEQVRNYAPNWMSPGDCMKQEYESFQQNLI